MEDIEISKSWKAMKRLEVKQWQAGMWQYLMDHSSPTSSGTHSVHIIIRNKENFWGRVQSRTDGDYRKVRAEREEDLVAHLKACAKEREFASRLDVITYEIRESGSFKDKVILYFYKKMQDYLYNKK